MTVTPDPSPSPFQQEKLRTCGRRAEVPRAEPCPLARDTGPAVLHRDTEGSGEQSPAGESRPGGARGVGFGDWPSSAGTPGSEHSLSLHHHKGTDTPPASSEQK